MLGQQVQQSPDGSEQSLLVSKVVLPDPDYLPSLPPKSQGNPTVTFRVPANLVLPELAAISNEIMAIVTSMPEASIDKNDQPLPQEDQVRLAQEADASSLPEAIRRQETLAGPP